MKLRFLQSLLIKSLINKFIDDIYHQILFVKPIISKDINLQNMFFSTCVPILRSAEYYAYLTYIYRICFVNNT